MNLLQENLVLLLKEIDEVCRKNNIEYMLAAGGALGAVREGGFLPWDDDLDIYMTRSNWEKFKVVVEKNLPENRFLLHNDRYPMYANPLPRYGMKENTLIYKSFLSIREFCGQHVEIFIFDPLPNDEGERKEYIKYLKVYAELMSDYFVVNSRKPSVINEFDYELYKKFKRLSKIIGKKQVLKRLENILFSVPEEKASHYIMRWGVRTYIFESSLVNGTSDFEFEGITVKISKSIRKLLRDGYGDSWIFVPKAEGQISHNGIFLPDVKCGDFFDEIKNEIPTEKKLYKYYKKVKKRNLANNFIREKRTTILNSIIADITIANNIKSLNVDIPLLKKYLNAGELKNAQDIIFKYFEYLEKPSEFGEEKPLYYNEEFSEIAIQYFLKRGEFFQSEKQLHLWKEKGILPVEKEVKYENEIEFSRKLSIAMYDNLSVKEVETLLNEKKYKGIETSLYFKAKLWLAKNRNEIKNLEELLKYALKYNQDDGELLFYLGYAQYLLGEEYEVTLQKAANKTRNGLILTEIRDSFRIIKDKNSDKELIKSDRREEVFLKLNEIFKENEIKSVVTVNNRRAPKINILYKDLLKLKEIFEKEGYPFLIEDHLDNNKLLLKEAYIVHKDYSEYNLERPFRLETNGIKVKVIIEANDTGLNRIKMLLSNGLSLVSEVKITSKVGIFWFFLYKAGRLVEKLLIGNKERKERWLKTKFYREFSIGEVKESDENLIDSIESEYDEVNDEKTQKLRRHIYSDNLTSEEINKILKENNYLNKFYVVDFKFKVNKYLILKPWRQVTSVWKKVREIKEEKYNMKKATNKDLQKVLDYIGEDYGKCLYIYLDIKEYGVEGDNISLWYDMENDEITVIVMKYYTGMHIYSRDTNFNREKVISLIDAEKPNMISSMSYVADYVDYVPDEFIREDGIVMKHDPTEVKMLEDVEIATEEDVDGICKLLETDEELGKPYGYDLLYKQLSERVKAGYGRSFILKKDGKIIGHSGTYAEGHGIAVHGGWIIRDDYKGQGLAVKLLNANIYALTKENITLVSICYIPAAIKAAKKVGSEILGGWTKIFKEEV